MHQRTSLFLLFTLLLSATFGMAALCSSDDDDDNDDSGDDDTADDDLVDDDNGDDDTADDDAADDDAADDDAADDDAADDDAADDDSGDDDDDDDDNDDDNDDNDTTPQMGYDVGDKMPDFTLLDQKGDEVSLYDYAGKVILLDTSAMWCGPCQQDTPKLETDYYQVYKDQGDGFMVLQLILANYNDNPPTQAELLAWATLYGLTFPVLDDSSWDVTYPLHGGSISIPAYALLDQEGVIRKKEGYLVSYDSLIESLLGID
ncbi:MAG: TlpA family protein disulfide reductase [Myxococcales bacterium]|nr:TlpA family protein disulfide reductase [Myxococcales bacterium]